MKSPIKCFGLACLLCTFELISSAAHSQTDSVISAVHPKAYFLASGGMVFNFGGSVGGIVDLSIIKNGSVFAVSFTSVDTGKVITRRVAYRGIEVAYAADLWQDFAIRYGRVFGNTFSVTAGIAWVKELRRSTINAGVSWQDEYSADLISKEHDYLGLPIAINFYGKMSAWNGIIVHAQTILSQQGIRWNAGFSFGLGIFPSSE